MGIISKKDQSYIGARLKNAQHMEGGMFGQGYVRVVCKSSADGKEVRDTLKKYWPETGSAPDARIHYEYMTSDNGNGNGLFQGWETFSVAPIARSASEGKGACDEINSELTAIVKGVDNGTIKINTSTEDPSNTDPDPGPDEKKSTNWITYLVIGAALVAIILLLWKRKK